MTRRVTQLMHRAILSLTGKDVDVWLQGLITNDVRKAEVGKALYSFLLDQRGRIIEDLILYKYQREYFLECDSTGMQKLERILKRYVMHRNVIIVPSCLSVYFVDTISDGGFNDPRVPSFGGRLLSDKIPVGIKEEISFYNKRRLEFGIVEGLLETGGGLPLSRNADFMNGISGDKGCYIGQETSATALNASRVRQRAMPFTCEGKVSGDLFTERKRQVGTVLNCDWGVGVALVTLSQLSFPAQLVTSEGGLLTVYIPKWWPRNFTQPYRLSH